MIVLAERRTCGTFAALSLVLGRIRPCFSRTAPGAPALFDGIRIEAYVARNKVGGSGQAAVWRALVDPARVDPMSPAPTSSTTPIAAPVAAQRDALSIRSSLAPASSYRDGSQAHLMKRPRRVGGAYEYAR